MVVSVLPVGDHSGMTVVVTWAEQATPYVSVDSVGSDRAAWNVTFSPAETLNVRGARVTLVSLHVNARWNRPAALPLLASAHCNELLLATNSHAVALALSLGSLRGNAAPASVTVRLTASRFRYCSCTAVPSSLKRTRFYHPVTTTGGAASCVSERASGRGGEGKLVC